MKEFLKTSKGKLVVFITAVLVIVGGIYGFNTYSKYVESTTPHIVFKENLLIGTSDDPLTLIKSSDAEVVQISTIVADDIAYSPDQLKNLIPGEYKFIYDVTKGGKNNQVGIDVVVIDNTAPIIENVPVETEVDYGTEYLLNEKATDNIDGELKMTINKLDISTPQKIVYEFVAIDTAGNETRMTSTVNVKAPACALNATFNWESGDCECNAGYNGDGWSSCTLKKTASSNSTTPNKNNLGSNSSGTSGQSYSNSTVTSNSNGGNGWTVDVVTQDQYDSVYKEGVNEFGDGTSWAGIIYPDGSYVIGQ